MSTARKLADLCRATAALTLALAFVIATPRAARAEGGYKLGNGETLAAFAEKRYGSKHYMLTLAKLNKLDVKAVVPPGTELKAPDLKSMVFAEGLPKEIEGEIERVVNARYQFMRARNDLVKAMESGPSAKPAQVPLDIKKALKEAADELEESGKIMAKKAVFAESAVRVRQRLSECAKNLRKLADGDRDLKLEDSVHRLIAQAFVRLLTWARLEDG